MHIIVPNALVVATRNGTSQQGKPFTSVYVQQDGGRVDELSVNLDKTNGELPERDSVYDFNVDLFEGQYGVSKRIVGFRPVNAPALAKAS